MAWGEGGRWVQGEISATGRPGRQGDCYLLVPGAKECPTVVGPVVGSDPSPPGGGQAAEGGVQQVQKLELRNPICRMASSFMNSFLNLIGSLGPWEEHCAPQNSTRYWESSSPANKVGGLCFGGRL